MTQLLHTQGIIKKCIRSAGPIYGDVDKGPVHYVWMGMLKVIYAQITGTGPAFHNKTVLWMALSVAQLECAWLQQQSKHLQMQWTLNSQTVSSLFAVNE